MVCLLFGRILFPNFAKQRMKKVDKVITHEMRMISGTLESTSIHWFTISSYILPPRLRKEQALIREYQKILRNLQLLFHSLSNGINGNRQQSRIYPFIVPRDLSETTFFLLDCWRKKWKKSYHHKLTYVVKLGLYSTGLGSTMVDE